MKGRPPIRARRLALAVLAAASPLALLAFLVSGLFAGAAAGRFADGVLAAFTAVVPVALMALGAFGGGSRRERGLGRVFLALGALLAAAALGVLALSGRSMVAAVVQIAGLWLLPLPLATLGYALTFDRTGLSRDELDALRRRSE